ncbi:prenyltransferase/squalene oxidase repeat-containing protein [Bacillus sp. JCM 19041]|uniref:prenyltransferase/squalene oxidase repeat-containing protein n=1 Tax=Bacillus sp. JCM 19041 TaxID=1460637 RepID=UPI000A59E6EF
MDTALAASAMQAAGIHSDDPSFQRATGFLIEQRHTQNGGWGFSKSNSIHPDVDDTQAALRALTPFAQEPHYRTAWRAGVSWLLERQNKDGGWAAFEKNSRSSLVRLLNLQNLADTALDPSAADLTGRTIEFLSRNVGMDYSHPTISMGVDWLVKHQQEDGSWKGRWGISYIYGTWASVTGMRAAGLPSSHPSIIRAMKWLESARLSDLGWGESCMSDIEDHFVPLTYSTVVHTAWALDTLVAVHEQPTSAMQQTLSCLLEWMQEESKRTNYPTGAGLPGQFYIHYHSYRYIWPLVAISHYAQKYEHTQMRN